VVLRPEELVALAPARLRRRLPPELFRLRVVGTTRGRDRVARGEARRRQGVPGEDRPRRRDLHGLRVQLPDAARAGRGVRPRRVRRRRAGGDARVDVSPAGNAGLDLHLGRVPRARGGRVRLPRHVGAPPPRARQPRRAGDDHGDPVTRMPRLRVGGVFVIMLHGPYGEDGTIQGLFELADLPYVGAGVLASAVGMDKATMKAVFQAHGLPVVEHLVVARHEWRGAPERVARRVAETLGFPCFVKPSNLGSSVGISKVRDAGALPRALDEAARYDRKILVERAVSGREIEVSVLGNNEPVASLPGEITYTGEFYDYATKYADGQARLTVPAPLPAETTRRIRALAL